MRMRPALVGHVVTTRTPRAALASPMLGSIDLAVTIKPGFDRVGGKAVIAPRGAARDLEIDEAVAHAIARDDFAQDAPQRRLADRRGDAQARASERFQPREMTGLVDQPAAADLADFVDAVAELEGAILDRHRRLARGDR